MLPQKIVIFGGSSVAGVGDPVGGGFADRLKRWHQSQHYSNIVFNLGVNGDTTKELITRLIPEAAPRKPSLIIISVGSNDIYRQDRIDAPMKTSIREFSSNIHTLISKAESLSDVVFLSAYPINESKTTPLTSWNRNIYYLRKDQETYQNAVKNICLTEKIPYCDVYTEWLTTNYDEWLTEDGLHANPTGHEKVYVSLRTFLEKVYPNW